MIRVWFLKSNHHKKKDGASNLRAGKESRVFSFLKGRGCTAVYIGCWAAASKGYR